VTFDGDYAILKAQNHKEGATMDALETGKRIQELRKQHGWTQKELAERICVSDKAVSKWERGLNFPDMALLKPLANVLDTSVMELLGIENEQPAQTAEMMTEVAAEETARLQKEIRNRALICLTAGVIWIISQLVIANAMTRLGFYDKTIQVCSIGMSGFAGSLIGNSLWIWRKHRK
jgi:transcriptional regulator with XRE-family HTH domain